jgi:hypothetical protein
MTRFVIDVEPLHAAAGQLQLVVADTTSAVIVFPRTLIFIVLTLAVDWLTLDEPEVDTFDEPTLRTPETEVPALESVIFPPALGSGPVSATAVVTGETRGAVIVTLAAVAWPL